MTWRWRLVVPSLQSNECQAVRVDSEQFEVWSCQRSIASLQTSSLGFILSVPFLFPFFLFALLPERHYLHPSIYQGSNKNQPLLPLRTVRPIRSELSISRLLFILLHNLDIWKQIQRSHWLLPSPWLHPSSNNFFALTRGSWPLPFLLSAAMMCG